MKLFFRRLLGAIERLLYPSSGYCHRCKRPWEIVRWHATRISKNSGCFPLCESCWQDLTTAQRLPYYFELFEEWRSRYTDDNGTPWDDVWVAIQKAVLSGR